MRNILSSFLSVIVPVYNKEKYVGGCIRSILDQTYKNIEVIIINDGSTDDTAEILKSFNDNRIKLIEINNSGVSTARNIGINNANGKYVIFVDGDDTIAPDYCERIADEIIKYDCPDLLIFGLQKNYPSGKSKLILPFTDGVISVDDFRQSFMSETVKKEGIYGYICNKAVKREILQKYNIKFDAEIRLAEDFDFWLQVYSLMSSVAMSSYYGYNYVQETEDSSIFLTNNYNQLIGIWTKCHKYLSPCNGHNSVLLQRKMLGLCEAKLLDLLECNYTDVKLNMQYISSVLLNIDDTFRYIPESVLQYLIKNNSVLLAYFYLKMRKAYHKLKLCVK